MCTNSSLNLFESPLVKIARRDLSALRAWGIKYQRAIAIAFTALQPDSQSLTSRFCRISNIAFSSFLLRAKMLAHGEWSLGNGLAFFSQVPPFPLVRPVPETFTLSC